MTNEKEILWQGNRLTIEEDFVQAVVTAASVMTWVKLCR
jgi:hypothetical protein